MMSTQAVMNTQVHAPRTDTALAHVLAIDDDPILREAIADYLGQHEFRVTAVADGRAMQAVLADEVVDLVVLDLKLQAEDGMALARRLREESAIPIIMLTGRREEADRVMGLELGADDYLTKPFSPRELLARIRAVLRRRRPEIQQGRPEGIRAYRFDGWELNLNTRRLKNRDGQRRAALQRRVQSPRCSPRGAQSHSFARPAPRHVPPAQRRRLQPIGQHSGHAAAAQARDRSGEPALHPYRARRGVRV